MKKKDKTRVSYQIFKDYLTTIRGRNISVVVTISTKGFLCYMETAFLHWFEELDSGLLNLEFSDDSSLVVNIKEAEIFMKEEIETTTFLINGPKKECSVEMSIFLLDKCLETI